MLLARNRLKIFGLGFLCWMFMLVMTFKVRFFEVYLPDEKMIFGDLKYVLACGNFENIEIECNDYMYGRWLLYILDKFSFLHPFPEETSVAVVSVSLIAVAHVLARQTNSQRIFSMLLFLSPPMALLIQRGNIDIVIFFLCWYGTRLFFSGFPQIGLILILFASILKIYPAALFVILLFYFLVQNKSFALRISWLTVSGALGWSTFIDIANIPWLPSDARNGFGLRIFGEYSVYAIAGSGKQISPIYGSLIGIFLIGIISFLFLKFGETLIKGILIKDQEAIAWVMFFILIFVSGISIDYRLIFLLPVLSAFGNTRSLGAKVSSVLILFIFYFSFPTGVYQVFGDLSMSVLISISLVAIARTKSYSK